MPRLPHGSRHETEFRVPALQRTAGADWRSGACLQGPAPRGGRAGRRVLRAPSHPLGLASLVEVPGLTAANNKPPVRLLCCAGSARTTAPASGAAAHTGDPRAEDRPRGRAGALQPRVCRACPPPGFQPGPSQAQHCSGFRPPVDQPAYSRHAAALVIEAIYGSHPPNIHSLSEHVSLPVRCDAGLMQKRRGLPAQGGREGAGPTQTKPPKPNKAGCTGGLCVFGESPGKTGGGQCAAQANGQGRTQGSGRKGQWSPRPLRGGGGKVSACSSHVPGPPGPEQRSPDQGGACAGLMSPSQPPRAPHCTSRVLFPGLY